MTATDARLLLGLRLTQKAQAESQSTTSAERPFFVLNLVSLYGRVVSCVAFAAAVLAGGYDRVHDRDHGPQ